MDRENTSRNLVKDIFFSFIKKNIASYIVLCILTFISEIGMVYLVYRLGKFLEFECSSETRYVEMKILLVILCVVMLFHLLKQHLDFKLSNEGLINLEKHHLDHLMHCGLENTIHRNKIELAQQINNDCVVVSDYYISQITLLLVKILKIMAIAYVIVSKSSASFMALCFIKTNRTFIKGAV